jgi:hypothetical protein
VDSREVGLKRDGAAGEVLLADGCREKQLEEEMANWNRLSAAIDLVIMGA